MSHQRFKDCNICKCQHYGCHCWLPAMWLLLRSSPGGMANPCGPCSLKMGIRVLKKSHSADPSRRGRSADCRPNNIRVVGLSCRGSVTSGGRGLRPTQGTVQREAIRDCVLSWMRPARWACVSRCPFSISHKKIIVSRCARQARKEKTYAAAGSLRSGLDRAHMSTDVGTESEV